MNMASKFKIVLRGQQTHKHKHHTLSFFLLQSTRVQAYGLLLPTMSPVHTLQQNVPLLLSHRGGNARVFDTLYKRTVVRVNNKVLLSKSYVV